MASNLVNICVLTVFFFCLNSTFGIPLSENVMVLTKGKQHNRVTRQADEIDNPSVLGSDTNKEQKSKSNKNINNSEIKNNADGPNVEQGIKTSSIQIQENISPESAPPMSGADVYNAAKATGAAAAAAAAAGGDKDAVAAAALAASTATAVSVASRAGVEQKAEITAPPVSPALSDNLGPPPSPVAPISLVPPAVRDSPGVKDETVTVAVASGIVNKAPPSNNALNTGPAANTGANANAVNGVTNTNGGFGTNTGVGLNTITVLNLDDRDNESPYKDGLNININPAVAVNEEGKLASSTTSVESIASVKAAASALAMNLKGKRKLSLNAKKAQLIDEIERETLEIRSRYDEKKRPYVDLKEKEERIDDETKIKKEENILGETKTEKVEQQEGSDKKPEEIEEVKEDMPRRKYRPNYESSEEEYDPYDESGDRYERRRPAYGRRPENEEVDRLIRLLESIRNAK